MRGLLALLCLLPACRFTADYDGTGYACGGGGECPAGQTCVAERCVDDDLPPPDAAVVDTATPVADAASADAPPPQPDAAPPPNLLANGDIEAGELGWDVYQSVISVSTVMPHGGANSLKACKVPDGVATTYISTYADAINGVAIIPAGTQFTATAWARASTLGEPPPASMRLVLREATGVSPQIDHFGPYLTGLTMTWMPMTVSATIEANDHRRLTLIIEADNVPDGTCFVVDDAYVGQLP